MNDVVITAAARTAIGSYGGSLKDIPPTELGATAAQAAIERAAIDPEQVDQVVFGNVIHTAPEDMYMARVVGIKAGRPEGGARLHRQPPVRHRRAGDRLGRPGDPGRRRRRRARRRRRVDEPRALLDARRALGRAHGRRRDGRRRSSAASPTRSTAIHMGITAENLAESHAISREAPGRVRRRVAPPRAGRARSRAASTTRSSPSRSRSSARRSTSPRDEHIRPDIDRRGAGQAADRSSRRTAPSPPATPSGMNDAGAAVVLMSAQTGARSSARRSARGSSS